MVPIYPTQVTPYALAEDYVSTPYALAEDCVSTPSIVYTY
jgi:hypothetical protein